VDYSGVTGTNACTYLTGWTDATEIQALTINENTFLTNRTKTVAMKTATADKSPAVIHEAIIELKTISYGKQYAIDIYDPTTELTQTETRATAIALDEHSTHGSFWNGPSPSDGSCKGQGREVITKHGVGLGSRTGNNLRLEYDVRCVPVVDPDNVGGSSSGAQYNDSYTPYVKLQFGGEGWEAGDTFNVSKEDGITSQIKVTKHATITSRGNVARVRPAATSSSADEAVTASAILGDMKAYLDALSTNITTTITGNSLHLSRPSAFNVTTPEPQLLNIVTSEAQTMGDLPKACRHGMVVKVINSGEEDDDYYLKFKTDNQNVGSNETLASAKFGTGVWLECPAPNLEIKFDQDTLPMKLVRELPSNTYANGRFLAQTPSWIDRDVGDDTTNPKPTFLDFKINKLLFFRNRLAMLSQENVILSRTNDFFNFWSVTAMAVSNDDPIDLQSSSTFPTELYDGIEVNSGLLLFSSNQQFMLTTDSDALTPSTAKINYLSSYNFNHKTKPFSLGVTSGFINSTGKNARFYEMADIRREGEPTVLEQSKLVSKLLPIDLTQVASSRENNIVLFGSNDKSEIWGYKFFNTGEKRVQSAWFRWEMPGNLVHHTILDDIYYTVVKNGSDYTLEAYGVKDQSNTYLIGTSPDDYRIHLDCHSQISSLASNTYNTTTKKTIFPKPAGYNSSKQLVLYDNNTGNNIGRYGLVTVNGSNLEVDGNWTGVALILGYQMDWLVELPKIYPSQVSQNQSKSDTRSSLIVHRLKFSFGSVGYIQTTIKRTGRPDYSDTYESLDWDTYTANSFPITSEYIHTIPIYERNTNLTVQLKSDHPSPATLHSLNWEGDYTNRFYQRA
jgi:hypothetical protein